ncbi:hypothetical protein [Desulfospira joergensenii]|uniref:hypothetical protein n=1 Tax=Desulfospira joergensenii TaxID=53329 RepID=UPI0003B3E50E|nr:hypothetical protein [Desulfospira joergensenii]
MTQKTTDRVIEEKVKRQNMMDKLSIEAGQADTCRPEGRKDLYVRKLEERVESLKNILDHMTEKSREMEEDLRQAYESEKKTLESRLRNLQGSLGDIRRASEDAWQEMGAGTSKALKELVNGFKSAASKLK